MNSVILGNRHVNLASSSGFQFACGVRCVQAHMGVKGVVRVKGNGTPLVDAVLSVERILSDPSAGGSDYSAEVSARAGGLATRRVRHDIFSVNPFGDYYRLLLPERPFWIQVRLLHTVSDLVRIFFGTIERC